MSPRPARPTAGQTLERRGTLLLLALAAVPVTASAQVTPPPLPGTDSVTVTPGAAYATGGLYSALMGGGYRQLWIMPIRVPVADLERIGGGLTPERVGGGMTTQTLHLDGADGRRYVFRSVNKVPADLLEDFEGSPVEAIIQDQISSFHPTGAPVVARLLEAVGVLHPEPRFMVVPDDPRLAEFREQFAGLLVLVEERPDDGPDGTRGFAGSRRIVQTDDLFDALEEDPTQRVDARELLRARLVDILVGDRDRSHNNHLWARFEDDGGGFVWRVIPRDRDQAFVRFDGYLKGLARWYERRLVNFEDVYPDIHGLTRNAWDIDRNLLVGLEREAWRDVVRGVVSSLTDDVIDDAVSRLPPEHEALVGNDLRAALLSRRDHLPRAAQVLYGVVFEAADVHGTDVDEALVIERHPDGRTAVTLVPEGAEEPSFERTFFAEETSEVRIYLHGGDDVLTVLGEGDGPLIRVIGGGGEDAAVARTTTAAASVLFYDDDAGTDVDEDIPWRRQRASRVFSWFESERNLDWGTRTVPEPRMSYDSDRGLLIVPGLRHERYGFLKRPYHDRIRVQAGWAFGVNEPIVDYRHLFRRVLSDMDVRLRFRWSGIEILNYYGLGNATAASQPAEYHRVTHKQVTATVGASFGDGERRFLEVGPALTYTSTDTLDGGSYVAEAAPYGSGKFTYAGLRTTFSVDERDINGTPTSGYRVGGGASYYPELFDVDRGAFGVLHGQVSTYLSPKGGNPVLALRAAGKRTWGTYPFTEAAFIGGAG
ncbi:MAG: hypothetical protein PVI57_15905, partial [Gemmatimonadota bacterium]